MSASDTEETPDEAQLLCEPPRHPFEGPGMRLVGHSAKLRIPLWRLPEALHSHSGRWQYQGALQGPLVCEAGPKTIDGHFLGSLVAGDCDPFSTHVEHP